MKSEIDKALEANPNATVRGYKITDKNMQCRGYQFRLGEWHKHDGEISLCRAGFHFCENPSGVWSYHDEGRVFIAEARGVQPCEWTPGADRKFVCREIRLIEEVVIDGDGNTGHGNTGNRNTGHCNTGHGNTGNYNTGHCNTGHGNTGDGNTGNRNTGNYNTGNRNTGHCNTGNRNTGHRNTGDGNTGDGNTGNRNTGNYNTGNRNTGHCNTGHGNTGNYNTGDGNTGHGNTGHYNTGDGNATNSCHGFFCSVEPRVISFDEQTEFTASDYRGKFPVADLCLALSSDDEIDYDRFSMIPGITPEKLRALHQLHIAGRKRDA